MPMLEKTMVDSLTFISSPKGSWYISTMSFGSFNKFVNKAKKRLLEYIDVKLKFKSYMVCMPNSGMSRYEQ